MSKLFVAQRVPVTYNRGAVHDLFLAIEQFVNALPQVSKGTFTLDADDSTTVADENVESNSHILLMETNADAAALQAGASRVYVSARTAGSGFAVSTADGGNAAGTETFQYLVINAA